MNSAIQAISASVRSKPDAEHERHMRRLTVIGLCAATGVGIPACTSSATTSSSPKRATASSATAKHIQAAAPQRAHHRSPLYPRVLPAARSSAPTDFVPAVRWNGQTAVWIARRSNLVLLSFDQRLVELRLHSGTIDAGAAGWRYGPAIAGRERLRLVAALNGGFSWMSTPAALSPTAGAPPHSPMDLDQSSPTQTGRPRSAPGTQASLHQASVSPRCDRTCTC